MGRTVGEVPVLMYHGISIESTPRFRNFVVRRDEFVAEMDYLTARGYRAITALEMALCLSSDFPSQLRQSILLTFDDAYTDFYACVLPVLQRYGLIATVYFSTDTSAEPPDGSKLLASKIASCCHGRRFGK